MGIKGFVEGGIASVIAGCSTHPLDLIKVRMQLQEETQAQNLRHALANNPASVHLPRPPPAIRVGPIATGVKLVQQEGVAALFSGFSATVLRQTLLHHQHGFHAGDSLAAGIVRPEMILEKDVMTDGLGTHVTASFGAGLVASNPMDVINTRVMNMKLEPGAAQPYSGALDCALKTVCAEGPMALYKGFIPMICRQGPFTVVLFVT